MRVLHKHAHHHPLLSFPRVKSEFTLGKPWVYPTQTPSLLRPIWKCINMQFTKIQDVGGDSQSHQPIYWIMRSTISSSVCLSAFSTMS